MLRMHCVGPVAALRHTGVPLFGSGALHQTLRIRPVGDWRSFLGLTSQRQKFHERQLVQFSPQQLFAVVSDVARYQEFVPFCTGSTIVRRQSDSKFDAELALGFMGMNEKYISRVTLVRNQSVQAEAVDSTLFKYMLSTWRFAAGPQDGTCMLEFDIELEAKSSMHAVALKQFFSQIADKQVAAFRERCIDIYKNTRQSSPPAQVSPPTEDHSSGCQGRFSVARAAKVDGVFDRHSKNGKVMQLDEFIAACTDLQQFENFEWLGRKRALAAAVFLSLDEDSNGVVDKEEFRSMLYMLTDASPQEKLVHGFRKLDWNNSGTIEPEDLHSSMQHQLVLVRKLLPLLMANEWEPESSLSETLKGQQQGEGTHPAQLLAEQIVEEMELEIGKTVAEVFALVDKDSKGAITMTEWVHACRQNPELQNMIDVKGIVDAFMQGTRQQQQQ